VRAGSITSPKPARLSSTERFTFLRLWVSEAERKTAAATGGWPGPAAWRAASSLSRPWPLGTSATQAVPAVRGNPATTSAASASWGIHRGDTKLVASMRDSPASASAWRSARFPSVGTLVASFCRPSRGPTS
jgi:hypothetical protein